MDTKILNQIGLSDSEIRVYFALLELNDSSVGPIIEKASVQDSKIYIILELIKKGLASFVVKNNVRYYQASDPNNLIELLDNKEKEIISQKQEIKKLLPAIEERRKLKTDKQEATVYEGIEGIKAAFNKILDTLKQREEYLVFTLGDELRLQSVKTFFQNYHKKRIAKKINVRLIINKKIKETFRKNHLYSGMNPRYTDLILPTGIFIYENKVMSVVWGEEPTAFVISSKANAERYREFFEYIWKIARR
jgi:sugar-specific transcriptional regulator TrmB